VGSRARLDDVEKRKFLTLPGLDRSSQPVASRYIVCAIPVLTKVYGPFFFAERTVTGGMYVEMLENWLINSICSVSQVTSYLLWGILRRKSLKYVSLNFRKPVLIRNYVENGIRKLSNDGVMTYFTN
jgi:hypothetical protein